MKKKGLYIVSVLPKAKKAPGVTQTQYYCHLDQYPGVVLAGSVGTKAKAQAYADKMNRGGGKKR